MDSVSRFSANDRRVLFENTAGGLQISPAIVEKDFWVCWTVKRLFSLPLLHDHLVFKGGTTLSKVYNVIQRFSEDIDLTIDRAVFGYGGEKDPEAANSGKKRNKMIEEMGAACSGFVKSDILDAFSSA